MKSKAFYLSLILLMTAIAFTCNTHHVKEIFKVTRDTIHVNIDGKLDEALLVNNKYYTFFEIRDSMKGFALKFYIIKKNGEVEKQIEVPEEVSSNYYYRLYYWQNQIIVKNTEYNISSYFLDEAKGIFVSVGKNLEIPVFEDEKYQITAACRGEFGSTIYFKNKLTGYVNSSPSGCPFLINKIGDRYFFKYQRGSLFRGN